MSKKGYQDNGGNDFIWIAGAFSVVFLGIMIWVQTHPLIVKKILIDFASFLSYPFHWFPYYKELYFSITHVPKHVIPKIPYEQIYIVLYKASIPYLIFSLFSVFLMSRYVWKKTGFREMFNTKFNMQSLLEHNVKMFPWLAPIAFREKTILEEPYDKGPWQTPRIPIQWADEHQLIVDEKGNPVPHEWLIDDDTGLYNERSPLIEDQENPKFQDYHLDFEKAKKQILKQYRSKYPVPDSFENFEKLPVHYQGIIAALMAFANGGEKSKKEALDLLNQMSLSFEEGTDWDEKEKVTRDYLVDIDGSEELFEKYLNSKVYQELLRKHGSFLNSFIIALTDAARDKGVIESSKYIWIRPTDNLLFNCLNQSSSTAWVEGVGPWAHYQLERSLNKKSMDKEYSAEIATKNLDWYLSDTGWYTKCKYKNKSALAQELEMSKKEDQIREGSQRTRRKTRG